VCDRGQVWLLGPACPQRGFDTPTNRLGRARTSAVSWNPSLTTRMHGGLSARIGLGLARPASSEPELINRRATSLYSVSDVLRVHLYPAMRSRSA
jgi:hypothetical protein